MKKNFGNTVSLFVFLRYGKSSTFTGFLRWHANYKINFPWSSILLSSFRKNSFEKICRQDHNTWMSQNCCVLTWCPPMHKIPHLPFFHHWIIKVLIPLTSNSTTRGFSSCWHWDGFPHGKKCYKFEGGLPPLTHIQIINIEAFSDHFEPTNIDSIQLYSHSSDDFFNK